MQALNRLKDGDLTGALASLQDEVRGNPADAKLRIFLFQLLAVLGDWNRALNQLKVAGELDAGSLAMVQAYRELLQCEAFRAQVFAGSRQPTLFGEPVDWAALYLQALQNNDDLALRDSTRTQAIESAPAIAGQINGEPFEWFADADSRLGPMIEAVVNGTYYWIPCVHIRAITIEAPEDLRDMVWTPAQFTWANEGQAVGFIPTRYPGSESHDDDKIRLAQLTHWQDLGEEHTAGLGQRMFLTSENEYPLLEVRELVFNA